MNSHDSLSPLAATPDTDPHSPARLAAGFPPGFAWGAGTSAFQIEGASRAGGRGVSIWDTFAATPGNVADGDTGEEAADHYHHYAEDVALLRSLGIGHYRFSVAWPRIQPDGAGPANPAGLDFYDRLVDALLDAGIRPWATLYHWDLPQPLEDAGGWPRRDTAHRFADYAALVHQRLGDRVRDWITVNEPWVVANLGYVTGEHAPGRREPAAAVATVHHLLLGHGLATAAIREQDSEPATDPLAVGLAHNPEPIRPHTDSDADRDAARRVDGTRNRIFLDPLYYGSYPADVRADLGDLWDPAMVRDGDLATIAAPLDFLGVNYYSPARVAAAPETAPQDGTSDGPAPLGWEGVTAVSSGVPRTDQDWEVDATGMTEILTRIAADYPGVALYVTENGASYRDEVAADGAVRDPDRTAYLSGHVHAVRDAIEAGAPVRGYFVWSLLDNFEWAFGYRERFGVVHVDFASQRRTVKDSGIWYSRLASGGEAADSAS